MDTALSENSLPMVSIVINSFNQAGFLEQTIQSVIDQDYSNLEILLVDGGSTDGSLEIIEKYAHRFRWWVSESDHGQSDGINKGLSRAKGELVAWLNSDDVYLPGAVAAVVKTWQTNREAALIYGDVAAMDERGKVFHRMKTGRYQLADLMVFRIINQPAVFMNRAILKQVGFLNLSYHCLMDHHLWLRMAAEGDMVYVNQLWAKARFHPRAKNVAQADKFGDEAYRIVHFLERERKYRDMLNVLGGQVMAGADRINARYLLDAGKPRQALDAYWQGMNNSLEIILPEMHRVLYCLLAMIGLGKLKDLFLAIRNRISPV